VRIFLRLLKVCLKTGTDPHPEVWCFIFCLLFSFVSFEILSYAVARLVEALHYKSEGCGFDFRWGYWDFSLT
jgi:hypothetical protein